MLKLNHVTKTFFPGTVNERIAINDITLHIRKGDFVTVIGSNGSGKSTLQNLIAGNLTCDRGKIFIDGNDVTFMSDHRRAKSIGRLFQDPLRGSAPNMTIEENMALAAGGGWFSHIGKKERLAFRKRLSELDMGLEERLKQPVGLLSGGQRQALTLLMATYVVPKLLLLDEHTAALDPCTADKVMSITKKTVDENNLTCVMVTHNMSQALEYGNRTLMMDGGRIVLDVSGEERDRMTVNDLLGRFKADTGKEIATDRMLLSK